MEGWLHARKLPRGIRHEVTAYFSNTWDGSAGVASSSQAQGLFDHTHCSCERLLGPANDKHACCAVF